LAVTGVVIQDIPWASRLYSRERAGATCDRATRVANKLADEVRAWHRKYRFYGPIELKAGLHFAFCCLRKSSHRQDFFEPSRRTFFSGFCRVFGARHRLSVATRFRRRSGPACRTQASAWVQEREAALFGPALAPHPNFRPCASGRRGRTQLFRARVAEKQREHCHIKRRSPYAR
jgi:hypothetical protein